MVDAIPNVADGITTVVHNDLWNRTKIYKTFIMVVDTDSFPMQVGMYADYRIYCFGF